MNRAVKPAVLVLFLGLLTVVPARGARILTVAAGCSHGLALKSDGTVAAWGYNGENDLGNGSFSNSAERIQVPGVTGVTAIAAGGEWAGANYPFGHSLALKSDGTVWAWGWNGFGQLGNGSYESTNPPAAVINLGGITALAAGGVHSLALSNGTVWAWGGNNDGQLGNGSSGNNTNRPIAVIGLSGVTALAAGITHSLAISNGQVWAWGGNYYGQLGNGTETSANQPVPVSRLGQVTAIAAGCYHSLAISNGAVWGWGRCA